MDRQVSYKLQERLSRIAEQRGQTLESLLATLADRLEEKSFPNTLHHFFENAVIPICVGDPDGRLVYVNPTLCRTLGYKREEMEEHFFRDFIHPDDRPKTMDTHAQVVNGQPVTRFENRYRHKNGSYHWLSWSVVLRDNLVYAIASQITDQKIAASKLRAALDQNERILRSIFDGYMLGDSQGNILDVNQTYCDMLGYTRGEIIAKTVYEIDAAMSEQAISNLRRKSQPKPHQPLKPNTSTKTATPSMSKSAAFKSDRIESPVSSGTSPSANS